MVLESSKQGGALVVSLKGRMDALEAPAFREDCEKLIEKGENVFIFDLTELEYISSAGLRSILTVAKQLKAKQGSMCFCNLQSFVEQVFSMSGFESMFPIFGSLEDALERPKE